MHSSFLSIQPSADAEQTPLKPNPMGIKGQEAEMLKNTKLLGLGFWDLCTQAATTQGMLS